MSVNAMEERFEDIELFGKPALFTNSRVERDTVPADWHCYDLRGSDNDPGRPVSIEKGVGVNHAGTVLLPEPLSIPKAGYKRLRGQLNFLGESVSLAEFCERHSLAIPVDNRKFLLRPASPDEAGLFYSQGERDAELATVGHLRFDYGSGEEFWHTWWQHNGDRFNTPEFKEELQDVMEELRQGPLKALSAMSRYCDSHGGALEAGAGGSFGYIAESDNYRYCLRCTPRLGDYSYIYIYDKRQQALNMEQKANAEIIGRVTFASEETFTYTDASEYLQTIREELPFCNVTGFQCETLTDDPAVRKAVDDALYDLHGEENPRRVCNYGSTEVGKQQLENVADPTRSHRYNWFVMTDVNSSAEKTEAGLTLDAAIARYRELDTGNKRIGVTKDELATVDIVVTLQGEERFLKDYERLAGFQNDMAIADAVNTLHQELDAPTQGMKMEGI